MCFCLKFSLFFAVVSLNCVFANVATPMTSKDYLDFRSKETKDLLLDVYAQQYNTVDDDDDDDDEVGKWKNLWSRAATSSQPRAVNLFDEMFFIDGQQVLPVMALNLDEDNNNTRDEHQLNLASPNQPIKFIKSYFWNGLSFLIVCQTSYCTHYQAVNTWTLTNQQVIKYPGFQAIDASFFTHTGQPHVVIAYKAYEDFPNGIPSSKVYRWNGTHMAYVDEIFVSAPKSVVAFNNGQSTIILFTIEQDARADASRDSAYVIYEFNDQSLLHQITSPTNVMDAAMSIYPYNYASQQFFLTINQLGAAEIFTWNGIAFEKLIDLPDVQLPLDQIHLVQIDNETWLFTSDLNALHMYKIKDQKVVYLNDLALLNKQRVVEISAWKYQGTIMLLLVKINPDGTFQTELWQMNPDVELSDNEKYKQVWACFRKLKDVLDSRAAAIKNFQIAQSRNLSRLNNSSEIFPLHVSDLIINDGNVSLVEFRNQDKMKVPSPQHVKEKLLELKQNMIVLQNNAIKNTATLLGNVSIDSYAYFDELSVDRLEVDYINGELADFENYLISGIDQQFPVALSVKKVSIDDLSVSSLCGYGFDHWMHVNDSVRSSIVNLKNANHLSIINDTIVIESELIMEELVTKNINGIELSSFLEEVFRIGKQQVIRGEVRYQGVVQVMKLYSAQVNNVSSSDLITKPSNQSLNYVFIDTLEVEHLYVTKINGVPIDKAARMSRENVIKGQIRLSNLIITDELTVNENIAIPLRHSTQVYDQINIDGNVFIKNLELEDHTSMNVSGSVLDGKIASLVGSSWRKSSDQTIKGPMTFEKGASIDQLDCPCLNGLGEQDFLYTDSQQLSDLENVTFANFHFNNVIAESSGSAESFVEQSDDYVTFYKSVRMRYLSVDHLFTDKYNGIPIESIMQSSDSLGFPDDFEFETVRVDGGLSVDDLCVKRLNRKSSETFKKALRIDENLTEDSLSAINPNFVNLNVSRLNGRDLERGLMAQENLLNEKGDTISLAIDGQVTIEGGMHVDRINNEEASDYMSRLTNVDPSDLIQMESLANLTIVENFDVGLLNGQKVDDDFFAASLSRTKRQTLDTQLTLIHAHMNYLTADAINNIDLMKLMYTDQPAVFCANLSFSDLDVSGNIASHTLNGENAFKLERKLHRIPISSIDNLLVQGDVKWDKPSSHLHSLARLLDNAATKHEDQLIDSSITFEKPLVVESLYLSKNSSEISQKISAIISDTVVNNVHSNPITVRGTKTFKHGLIVGNLAVDGNIDIKQVNGLDIRQISSQIFQKDKAEIISANITFSQKVEIARLVANKNIHGIPLQQLAVVGEKMPKKLHFKNLAVDGNVSLYKLDGVDFDDFIKRRVTTDQDNEIFVDVEFSDSVQVTNGTFVTSVNEIIPENLALNNVADGTPIMIHGNKIFNSKLDVELKLETPIINNFQVNSIYDKAILNGSNAGIHGSLVFTGDVQMSGNSTVSREVNGLKLQPYSEIKYLQNRFALNTLNKDISLLYDSLNKIEIQTKAFDATVLYLEEEKKLNWQFARVQSIKSSPAKNKTRLEIITTETYASCGLQNDCSCKKQYIIDILPSGEYEIEEQNTNNISWTFYPPEGTYGLKIISQSASYSDQCSKTRDALENSKIFWLKFHENQEIIIQTPALVISDYISDAQLFQVGDQLYLIVAIFFSKETRSHATNSLLYEFDLKNAKSVLVQTIPTNGAKSLHVFQVPNLGMHVLIGCVKGRAESLLLRFNPSTRQMIRAFATGGSKYVASVSTNEASFVILNNPDVKALQIFNYDENYDNFVDYQNIFFESRVTSLGVFYSGDFGHGDAFLVTTTRGGWLYIYEYMFHGKFQLKMSYWADDIQVLTPFRHMSENYLFAVCKFNSKVYKVIQQGYY